jgi:hypothetical protein
LEALENRLAPSVFTVNSTGDTGSGSGLNGDLRYCITQANTNAGNNTIQFDPAVFGSPQTITLTRLLPAITDNNLTISHFFGRDPIISGNHLFQVFDITAANVSLRGLIIANGKTTNAGGGIAFTGSGTLALFNTVISGNSSTGNGGGVYNLSGTLTVTSSFFSSNSGTNGGGIFTSGASLALTNSTLSGNSATNDGGGIYNKLAGTLTLTGSTLSGNSAHNGGGIHNVGGGTLTLTNSTLSTNSATAGNGGGISTGSGSMLTVTNSTLSTNSATAGNGGGISTGSGSTLTVTNSTLSTNSASHGGGIWNGGTLTSTNSTLSANSASLGGGIWNGGKLTLTTSTLSGNSATGNGGGIFSSAGAVTLTNSTLSTNSATAGNGGAISTRSGSTLTVTNSTLAANFASLGGGIWNGGKVSLTDSTLSGNSAVKNGGGINNYGKLTLTNSTLSGNSAAKGGGIYDHSGSLSYLNNTLSAGNTASSSAPDVFGAVNSTSGFNLIGDGSGMNGIKNGVNGNQIGTSAGPINPHLSALGFWVGLTQTMVPLAGSPALDAGSNALDGGVTTDQRGLPRIFNGRVDIGAAEFRGPGSTLTVNSTADTNTADNVLTLREALDYLTTSLGRLLTPGEQAQVVGDPVHPTTIQFAPTVFSSPQTITLSSGLPTDSFNNVTIKGPGANRLTISGNHLYQVLNITAANASISGLTIANGNSGGNGGGISFNGAGTLALANAVISGNSCTGSGGGVYNEGTLRLTNSTLSGNSSAGNGGGGLYNKGTLTLTNSTLSGNSTTGEYGNGAGLYNKGTLTLTNSTLSGNSVSTTGFGNGGGLWNKGMLTLTKCILSGNYADHGGGIGNGSGTLTLTNSTLSGNSVRGDGGGINNYGTLTLTNCTLVNNRAYVGGGIFDSHGGNVSLTNSTLSGNSSGRDGGGIFSYGTLTLDNTLIAGNTTSGTAPFGGPDVWGAVDASSRFSLIGDGTLMTGITNGVAGNQIGTSTSPINPLLASLGNYGGPTQTFALLPGSPALDAGSNALDGGATTDQRGHPRIVNGTVDIGAFESQGFTVTASGGNNQSTVVNTPFPSGLTVTVSSTAGEPVAGGMIKFTAPSSGASAVLSPTRVTLTGSGQAVVTATANNVVGSYKVVASAGGANASNFNLTNRAHAATLIAAVPSTTTPKAGVVFSLVGAYLGALHFIRWDMAAVRPPDYTLGSTDSGKHTSNVILKTAGPETLTATNKAHAAIGGRAHATVKVAAAFDSLAANGFGGERWTPSLLDAFFADLKRELGGIWG